MSPKKQVHYNLVQTTRIGQVADELFYVKSMYPEGEWQVVIHHLPIQADPGDPLKFNSSFFQLAMSNCMSVPDTEKNVLKYHGQFKGEIQQDQEGNVLLAMPSHILRDYYLLNYNKFNTGFKFSLNEEHKKIGSELAQSFGIKDDEKIVTFHLRNGKFFSKQFDYHMYRESNVINLNESLEYLLKEGYTLIRLGDQSMPPLEIEHSRLIDAPFHKDFHPVANAYFISKSQFYFGTDSGPISIARGFRIPTLCINTPMQPTYWMSSDLNLVLYKHYFSRQLGRNLSYEEVLMSPASDFYRAELFEQANLELVENSSEELLAGVKDMVQLIQGKLKVDLNQQAMVSKIAEVHAKVHAMRNIAKLYPPYYGPHLTGVKISPTFLKMNPYFCGHLYSNN